MKLHELAEQVRCAPGTRLRISEFYAFRPREHGEAAPDGPQRETTVRIWTPPLTDAQMLAYWGRNVIRVEWSEDGKTAYAVVTGSDKETAAHQEAEE